MSLLAFYSIIYLGHSQKLTENLLEPRRIHRNWCDSVAALGVNVMGFIFIATTLSCSSSPGSRFHGLMRTLCLDQTNKKLMKIAFCCGC